MIVRTARMNYRGPDRLDITVKGEAPVGRAFAPTWPMVIAAKKARKDGTEDAYWPEYVAAYYERMRVSYRRWRGQWSTVLGMEQVTLVCFCPDSPEKRCHRFLLVKILETVCEARGIPFEYTGEVVSDG